MLTVTDKEQLTGTQSCLACHCFRVQQTIVQNRRSGIESVFGDLIEYNDPVDSDLGEAAQNHAHPCQRVSPPSY